MDQGCRTSVACIARGADWARAQSSRAAASWSRRLTLLLAVACSLAVSNVYYAQPLLDTMADAFGIVSAVAWVFWAPSARWRGQAGIMN